MSEFKKRLYLILYPNEALVASQLSPTDFGKHYAIGSPKHFSGKVIFVELQPDFRHDYFEIDRYLALTDSGVPGVPKKTKFIKSYRVLEHIDLKAVLELHLVTVDGHVLTLEKSKDFSLFHQPKRIRIYQEICPLQVLVASNLAPTQFAEYLTAQSVSKGAPKLFFTQFNIDVEDVLNRSKTGPHSASPLPNINPTNLNVALMELAGDPTKRTKTISLNEIFHLISFSKIKHGFWLGDREELLYYHFPDEHELEEKYYTWWRSVYK
jgi:hypothetical protein